MQILFWLQTMDLYRRVLLWNPSSKTAMVLLASLRVPEHARLGMYRILLAATPGLLDRYHRSLHRATRLTQRDQSYLTARCESGSTSVSFS